MNINSSYDKLAFTKDFPCAIACQVFVRDDKLDWLTMMRSQDLFYGTRNDVFCFTGLQQLMAEQLNIAPGSYTHFMSNVHLYEKQLLKAEKYIKELKHGVDIK
jgi:thymidylate synthase